MIDRGNEHQPYSSADRGAMEDVHSLRLLGHNAQEKLLILRHCVSSKLAHIARWGPADEYAEETEELNCAIERVVRDLAGERFEHPARTWASSSHRKFTHAAVGIAMAAATFRVMQATAKTAMRRVLGIRGGQGETLVPPTAVAGGDEGFVFEFEASDNNSSG
jgi:hypothetical protein